MPLRTLLRDRANRKRFRQAKSEAKAHDGTVCGFTKPGGEPVYFVMPKDATPEAVEREVFRRNYGRDPDLGELAIMAVRRRQAVAREQRLVATSA